MNYGVQKEQNQRVKNALTLSVLFRKFTNILVYYDNNSAQSFCSEYSQLQLFTLTFRASRHLIRATFLCIDPSRHLIRATFLGVAARDFRDI